VPVAGSARQPFPPPSVPISFSNPPGYNLKTTLHLQAWLGQVRTLWEGRLTLVSDSALELPPQQVEDLVLTIIKGLRAFQMYLPNNPIYLRSIQNLHDAFNPIWSSTRELALKVVETDLYWHDHVVYHQPNKSESFAWTLYKDGLRLLTLRPGVEDREIVTFLQTVTRARLLAADAGDDLLTLLWEQEFQFLDYRFAEILVDSTEVLDPQAIAMGLGQDLGAQAQMHHQVEDELAAMAGPGGDLDDFDSTLYFLEESEILTLRQQVEEEYQRDVRTSALTAVLDTFELQPSDTVREEVLAILEALFPNLLTRGEFRAVAGLLRELRAIRDRVTVIDGGIRARVESFEDRLSDPAILSQLLQVVEEAAAPGDEDVGELLKELRAPALAAILAFLVRVQNASVRTLLESAADRLARGNTEEVIRILRQRDSEGLLGAVGLSRRLQLQPALSPLGDLVGHQDAAIRQAAVEALGALGTPGALGLLERALDDPERNVRLAAVAIVGARGYKGALKRLELAVQGRGPHELERAEKRQFFEAYAAVAGPGGLPQLANILEPKGLFRRKDSPENRTCAAYAIGRIRSPEARALLERAAQDKDLPVRNAAARALREWVE